MFGVSFWVATGASVYIENVYIQKCVYILVDLHMHVHVFTYLLTSSFIFM